MYIYIYIYYQLTEKNKTKKIGKNNRKNKKTPYSIEVKFNKFSSQQKNDLIP